jgi:hypothetical protein
MNKAVTGFVLLFFAGLAYAASAPANFSGNWDFDPAQSKNVGKDPMVIVFTRSM